VRKISSVTVAGDFDYEHRGAGYAVQRRQDPSIAAMVRQAFGGVRTIVNVGAGAGSYEPDDLDVTAVEPSASMRSQRPSDRRPAINAVAEALPFADGAFEGALASITVHQWRNQDLGLRELRRVSSGPIVILTFDGSALERFWLADYAPQLIAAERRRYPSIEHICEILGGTSTVTGVPIPVDCPDGFTEAFYARPEQFLDPAVRESQSAWGFVTPHDEQQAVESLAGDLETGTWDRRYGSLRSQSTFVGSLRLIVAQPD
jgi:hypothetical protein